MGSIFYRPFLRYTFDVCGKMVRISMIRSTCGNHKPSSLTNYDVFRMLPPSKLGFQYDIKGMNWFVGAPNFGTCTLNFIRVQFFQKQFRFCRRLHASSCLH